MTYRAPPGACDAHVHVFGPASRFPYAPDRTYTPADAPKEALFALHARLGLQRSVVVQPGPYAFDNRATADVLAARPGQYRGVALLPPDISDATLQTMDAQGFRGIRFNYLGHLGAPTPLAEILALARRLVPLAWHLQIHLSPDLIDEFTPAFFRCPVPIVIDHMARIPADAQDPGLTALRRLLEHDHIWVKLSGLDRATRQGPPYANALPIAQTLAADAPTRILWGTDWPHPNHQGPIPDDQSLLDLVPQITPTPAAQQALLVDNPHRLYRFAPTAP